MPVEPKSLHNVFTSEPYNQGMKSSAIVWFRRDLRLKDNPALSHAIDHHERVILVYIHAPDEEAPWQPGAATRWWLHYSLSSFQRSLTEHGGELILRSGDSLPNLISLCSESGAKDVYWNRLYDPALVNRDKAIKEELAAQGIKAHSYNGSLLREPWEVHKEDGTMYRVYTPFSKKYLQMSEIEAPLDSPQPLPAVDHKGVSLSLDHLALTPTIGWDKQFFSCWRPGESGAIDALQKFIEQALLDYRNGRDLPATDGVSRLSPHLHFGEISPRQVWHEVKFHAAKLEDEGEDDVQSRTLAYLRQLIWRDFAHHILFHLPHTATQPFNEKFSGFEWDDNQLLLEAWQRGQTGIPLVDAGMRQLWQTGWMHNRVRMLVASVLTKNGMVHWLEGARWFWDTLLDADLANNSMGWQWTAGCGVDAAPYFRIFSPARQGERFDPLGSYVKKWVPELAAIPAKYVHQPWTAPAKILEQSGITLGEHYPEPVVDLSASRKEALARFKRLKNP